MPEAISLIAAAEELAKSIEELSAQTHSARELTNKTAEVKSLAQQTACRGAPTASVGVRSRLPTR
jgi:uncharacterized protein (DUF2345 family)